MERIDFYAYIQVIDNFICANVSVNQPELLDRLFSSFWLSDVEKNFVFDESQASRWINGQRQIPSQITDFYEKNLNLLVSDIQSKIFPIIFDVEKASISLHELLMKDTTLSWRIRASFAIRNWMTDETKYSKLWARILMLCLRRPFIKRETNGGLVCLGRGGMYRDLFCGCEVPSPCQYFCGRNEEISELHQLLKEHDKIFLYGIPGIGKSELAKAYAQKYKKDYSDILFIPYTGDLKKDIAGMSMFDDVISMTENHLYKKHLQYLNLLPESALIIMDNINATEETDPLISELLKIQCKVLFTTRNYLEDEQSYELNEIRSEEALFGIVRYFYPQAESYHDVIVEIIQLVHAHTFAVDLMARLLRNGFLMPQDILEKLRKERASYDDGDQIWSKKDGKRRKRTYREHISGLFALTCMNEAYKMILLAFSMMPLSGVSVLEFKRLMALRTKNEINDLIDLGLIKQTNFGMIAMHSFIQEIVIADLRPSTDNCIFLIERIRTAHLARWTRYKNYRLLCEITKNIICYMSFDSKEYCVKLMFDYCSGMMNYYDDEGVRLGTERVRQLADFSQNRDIAAAIYLYMHETQSYESPRNIVDMCIHISNLEKALRYFPEPLKPWAVYIMGIKQELAVAACNMDNADLAIKYMDEIEKIKMECHVEENVLEVEERRFRLGEILVVSGKVEEGLEKIENALSTIKNRGTAYQIEYADKLCRKGYLLQGIKKSEEAAVCFSEAIKIYKTAFVNYPDMLNNSVKKVEKALLELNNSQDKH